MGAGRLAAPGEATMKTGAIIKGGILAGVLINCSEFVLNTIVIPVEADAAGSMMFWVLYAFVLGLLVAYMYALVRPRWGPGPKTAACAGIMVWILHTLLPASGMANMGLYPLSVLGLGWTLAEMAVAGLFAGVLYSE